MVEPCSEEKEIYTELLFICQARTPKNFCQIERTLTTIYCLYNRAAIVLKEQTAYNLKVLASLISDLFTALDKYIELSEDPSTQRTAVNQVNPHSITKIINHIFLRNPEKIKELLFNTPAFDDIDYIFFQTPEKGNVNKPKPRGLEEKIKRKVVNKLVEESILSFQETNLKTLSQSIEKKFKGKSDHNLKESIENVNLLFNLIEIFQKILHIKDIKGKYEVYYENFQKILNIIEFKEVKESTLQLFYIFELNKVYPLGAKMNILIEKENFNTLEINKLIIELISKIDLRSNLWAPRQKNEIVRAR